MCTSLRAHPRDKKLQAAAMAALSTLGRIDSESIVAIRREGKALSSKG